MKDLEIDSAEICEKLISIERVHRHKTLKTLQELFENPETSDEIVKLIYEDCYLHILKCYSDKFENCRELACNLITAAITRLPKNDYYLQYVVSTIYSKIGKKEIIENSEELRLEFLKQLHFLIIKYSTDIEDDKVPDLLIKSYNEIIEILLKTLTDSFPAIQKEACYCIKALSLATRAFHYRADVLAKPLFPILHHKHSPNRIAAIESLGIVCIHIQKNSDLLVQIMVEISPLLMDPMPLVRLECGKVGCTWLLKLMDRYSFFERILPLVLCCLKDDSPDVRKQIDEEWKKCGKQFYDENESEMNTLEVIDEKPENYPKNIERPTLGCRALVQRALRVYKLIMRESADWKDDVRLHSLKLMYQFVLHAEHKLTAFVFEFFGDLANACADSVKEVANEAIKVADLIGRLIKTEDWIKHAIDNLQKHSKLGYLKCFYAVYSSTNTLEIDDILKISKIISSNEFSNNLKPEFQEYLLKLSRELWKRTCSIHSQPLETAVENLKLNSTEIEKNLYHVIIKVIALSFDEKHGSKVHDFGREILFELAKCDETQIRILHGEHLNSVLETFDCLDAEVDENTEPILLLHGVIRTCEYHKSYLKNLKKCILAVWENALPDGKIKIFSAISIAMLNWSKTIDLNGDESIEILRYFVEEIIVPHLKWKAGATAESMRSFATATLCSITQGAKLEAIKILPELASYYPNLIEDNSASTRCYALKCFADFGPVELEHLKPIGYAILQRLDDPCSEIREWAARVICKLKPFEREDMAENELEIWHDFIKYSFSMLFIHFDGPELKLRNCVKESLIVLGKEYPEIFKEKYKDALLNFTNKEELMEVDMLVLN